jgi:hypothetical protein
LKVVLTEQHKGFTLQARRGYFAAAKEGAVAETTPPPQTVAATDPDTKERIREAMFSSVDVQQLLVEVRTEISKEASGDLTVLAHLDAKSLRFHKEAARNQNTVTFVSAVLDQGGNLVTGQQWQAKVDLPDDALPKLRDRRNGCQDELSTEARKVHDTRGGDGFGRAPYYGFV